MNANRIRTDTTESGKPRKGERAVKLLEAEWTTYRNKVIPKAAGSTQLTESRRAFYAGAWALYTLMMKHLEAGTEETVNDLVFMEGLAREMEEFKDRVIQGLA